MAPQLNPFSFVALKRLVEKVRNIPGDNATPADWHQWTRSSQQLLNALVSEVAKEDRTAEWKIVRDLLQSASSFLRAMQALIEQSACDGGN